MGLTWGKIMEARPSNMAGEKMTAIFMALRREMVASMIAQLCLTCLGTVALTANTGAMAAAR